MLKVNVALTSLYPEFQIILLYNKIHIYFIFDDLLNHSTYNIPYHDKIFF